MRYDIIPDIHGQAGKLEARLRSLGYREIRGAWRHPEPDRNVLFLGDFIDRGPENAKVIDVVRKMVDAGTAQAIMGNHELNAIRFHTRHPETGQPLRAHSKKNMLQHASFLDDFPVGDPNTLRVIDWMKTLPLFMETDGFRVVHACWDEEHVSALRRIAPGGNLGADLHIEAACKKHHLYETVETLTKGPEATLPHGYSFRDKGGQVRTEVRLQWWNGTAKTWRDIAISTPDPTELPDEALPRHIARSVYPSDAPAVFFGHYWLDGDPTLQSHNALCLDYSAGGEGPLVAYRLEDPRIPIDLANLVTD